MKMKKLTATLLSAVLGVYAMAGDTLFQNGKTEWKIGISPKAAPAEQYAAQELQTALQKISGAEFPILKSETFPDGNTIIIGSPDSTPQIREKADALKLKKGNTEELAVYTLGGNLYLAGNNPRGALYAVYSFLQNQLGVRWFWPGDDGEFIRKKNNTTITKTAPSSKASWMLWIELLIKRDCLKMSVETSTSSGKVLRSSWIEASSLSVSSRVLVPGCLVTVTSTAGLPFSEATPNLGVLAPI